MRGEYYVKYLKSPQWEAKREHWFSVYGRWCRACGRRDGALPLHHLTYANLGREPLSDLVALCQKCHSDVEKLHRKLGRRRDRREVFQIYKANLKRR